MLEMALGSDSAEAMEKQQQQILQEQQQEEEQQQEQPQEQQEEQPHEEQPQELAVVDDGGDYVELADDRVENGESQENGVEENPENGLVDAVIENGKTETNGVEENPENETQVSESPPPPNPWKDEPKSCQPNYSVPKTLSKVPLPDSPPAERRPKKPSPPTTPNVDTLKLIEDQIEKPKPEAYKETEMDQIRLQAANKVLKVYEEKDVDWASSAARVVDRVVKHALPADQNGTEPEIDYLDYQETYDISILQTQKMRLPQGIDRSQLQNYLAEDQFEAAFHMSSEKFVSLPLWKKTNLKKNLHLF